VTRNRLWIAVAIAALVFVGLLAALMLGFVADDDVTPRARDTPVSVSPTGNDSSCSRSGSPCATFERAYAIAQPGDTIGVEAGAYAPGGLPIDPVKSAEGAAPITVTPLCSTPNCVTVKGGLFVPSSNVRLVGNGNGRQTGSSNFLIYKLHIYARSEDRSLWADNVFASGLHTLTFFISAATNVTFRDSEVGPFLACYGRNEPRRSVDGPDTICPDDPPYYPYAATGSRDGGFEPKVGPDGERRDSIPRNITLDGLYFHDINSSNIKNGDHAEGSASHNGCLFLVSIDGFVLRNSIFRSCVVYDIQIQDFTTVECCGQVFGPVRNFTFENNWFGQPVKAVGQTGTVVEDGCNVTFSCKTNVASDGQAALQFGKRNVPPPEFKTHYWQDGLLRFNSFQGSLTWNGADQITFRNVRVIGNAGPPIATPNVNCIEPGLVYRFNVTNGGATCDPTGSSSRANPGFVDNTIPGMDLHVAAGSPVLGFVTATRGDYELTKDFDGKARTAPRNAGSSGTTPG